MAMSMAWGMMKNTTTWVRVMAGTLPSTQPVQHQSRASSTVRALLSRWAVKKLMYDLSLTKAGMPMPVLTHSRALSISFSGVPSWTRTVTVW